MNEVLAEALRYRRIEKGYSQQQLANMLYVDRSTIASWETGRRTPNLELIPKIAACLDMDTRFLLQQPDKSAETPRVILVDDEKIILDGTLPTLRDAIPGAIITGFQNPVKALEFVKASPVKLAFLDIVLGTMSGMELCRELIKIQPKINVIFLTAYMDYAFSAWETGASGFLLKPVSYEAVRKQLTMLRYPIEGLDIHE